MEFSGGQPTHDQNPVLHAHPPCSETPPAARRSSPPSPRSCSPRSRPAASLLPACSSTPRMRMRRIQATATTRTSRALPASWLKVLSALRRHRPIGLTDRLKARAAPTPSRAPVSGQLGSLPWPDHPGSGRPKVEDSPLSTARHGQRTASAPARMLSTWRRCARIPAGHAPTSAGTRTSRAAIGPRRATARITRRS